MPSASELPLPSLESFLDGPSEDVAAVAPASMVLASAGTRRAALLQNISNADYGRWGTSQMLEACQRLFGMGVQDVFVSIIRSSQVAEGGEYGARLWSMARQALGDERWIASLAQMGFRIRCFGASDMHQITDVLAKIEQVTAAGAGADAPTLWWMFATTPTSPWDHALAAICAAGATTRDAAISAIYGKAVAPVGVYLAFGKPFFSAELMPPLLEGQAAAFWYQQPGYKQLTERYLRRIFYEAAYLRKTWTNDKGSRYTDVVAQRQTWDQPLTLGLGQRIGGFWYPRLDQEQIVEQV